MMVPQTAEIGDWRLNFNTKDTLLELSTGYRSARKLTALFCAIGIGWSAAQFDIQTAKLSLGLNVSFSNASISLILVCCILYMVSRCYIEYCMQTVEVRRWELANLDFSLTSFFAQAAILALAASGIVRSLETIVFLILATLVVIFVSMALVFIGMMPLVPLMMWLRARKDRLGAGSMATLEALAWAMILVIVLFVVLVIALAAASLFYEPVRSLWPEPPAVYPMIGLVVGVLGVAFSFIFMHLLTDKMYLRIKSKRTKFPGGGAFTGEYDPVNPDLYEAEAKASRQRKK